MKLRNSIVYWITWGRYDDGIISAPNVGFTYDNEWYPVVSFGGGEIKTAEQLVSVLGSVDKRKQREVERMPLTQKTIDRLQNGMIRVDYLCHLVDKINEITDMSLEMTCTKCGKKFSSTEYSFSDIVAKMASEGFYSGNGGVDIITRDMWCDECRDENNCAECTGMTLPEQFNYEEQFMWAWLSVCSTCTYKFMHVEKYKHWSDDISDLEDKIDEDRAQLKKYLAVMKEGGSDEEQLKQLESDNLAHMKTVWRGLVNDLRDKMEKDVADFFTNVNERAKDRLTEKDTNYVY